jgi:hypothetical protein
LISSKNKKAELIPISHRSNVNLKNPNAVIPRALIPFGALGEAMDYIE